MNLRFWMILIGVVVTAILNGFIIYKEQFVVKTEEKRIEEYRDRLADSIKYAGADDERREHHLRQFGFDNEMIKLSKKEFKRLDGLQRKLLKQINGADEPEIIAKVFCLRSSENIRPRYAAIRILIKEEKEKRLIHNPRFDKRLEVHDIIDEGSLASIYDRLENVKNQTENSTVLMAAAFLTKKEEYLKEQLNDLDWEVLMEADPKIKQKVVNYICLMHVIAELANDEDSICG